MNAHLTKLQWKTSWVTSSLATQMDHAISLLSEARDEQYQRITSLFGRRSIAFVGSVVIFKSGTSTRPATITAIALDQNTEGRIFFLDRPDQIYALCDYIRFEDPSERQRLIEFVTPRSRK